MQVPSNSVSAPPTDSATPATPTDTGAPGSGGGGGGGGSDSPMQPQQPDPVVWPTFPTSKTLLGNYTPLIVGRGISLLLSGMFSVLALHDPVRHLTSLGGANGAQVMGATVGVSDAGSFVALLGGGLSAGLTYVDTNWCEAERQPGNLNPCPPRLTQTPWVVDVIIGTLVVQTALIAVAAAQWFKRPSGLSADPTTIAGVAAVMGHPEVERQFASYPAEMTSAQLAKEIKTQQWKLGTFYTAAGAVKYGIMPVPESERRRKGRQSAKGTPNEGGFFTRISIKLGLWKESIKWLRDWKNNRLYFDLVFIMLLLALIGLTAAAVAHVDRPQVVFLAAAGNGVGMRIFFAILGIIVSVYWGRIFQDAQTFTPYILLSEGDGAPPKTTILLSRHSVPFTAFFPLLFAGHFGAASVAFTGIFAELLIIFLAGLPYRPGQLRGEFLFCGVSALAILAIMLVQVIAINIWRRRLPHLPRRPDNIAAVMTYVAATGMARDFDGLEGLSVRERNKAIVDMGKNYAYGWRREEIMPMPAGVPGGMEYHSGYATNAGTAGGSRVRWVIDQVAGDEGKSLMVRGSEDTRV